MSAWDFSKLEEELASLDISGIDMSDLKFDLGNDIDWNNVKDLTPETYEEPDSKKLRCPVCGAVDYKIHFKEVSGGD